MTGEPDMQVVVDMSVYPRDTVNDATTRKYAALMREGVTFPPIIVERGTRLLLDGMHRYRAAGDDIVLDVVEHDIPSGSNATAYSALLNQGHGIPMRDSELKPIAQELFRNGATVAEAARHIGAPRTTVQDWVEPLLRARREEEQRLREVRNIGFRLLAEAGWTQQRIADHHGVSQQAVAKIITTTDESVVGGNPALVWEAVATYSPTEPAVSGIAQQWLNPAPKPHVSNNSGENEWYTPPDILTAARAVFAYDLYGCYDPEDWTCPQGNAEHDGNPCDCPMFDCDPASSDVAQATVRAATYYTAESDGLAHEWHGAVWLNPPYSQPLIGRFVDKLIAEMGAGRVKAAIVLVNNGTETTWGQQLQKYAGAVCFPRGRIRFVDAAGNPGGAPLQGQMILYLGDGAERDIGVSPSEHRPYAAFCEQFSQFGKVWTSG